MKIAIPIILIFLAGINSPALAGKCPEGTSHYIIERGAKQLGYLTQKCSKKEADLTVEIHECINADYYITGYQFESYRIATWSNQTLNSFESITEENCNVLTHSQ
jgi:hypothetical protein